MDDEPLREKSDAVLAKIGKDDLYSLSVDDLKERIASLKAEIARCEAEIDKRASTRSAADSLFKF